MAKKSLTDNRWAVTFRPDPPCPTSSGIRLSLKFSGRARHIAIKELKITTKAPAGKKHPQELVSRIPENPNWILNEKILCEEIFGHPERLRHISFAGGEPLINPYLPQILEKLVSNGHAKDINLFFSSNGTVYSKRLAELLKPFKRVMIAVSLDGTGALQEYIRPPSRWEAVSRNLLAFAEEKIPVAAHATPQAYNIFGLMDLVRFCDSHRIHFALNNVLYHPDHLSLDMMPQPLIDEALTEWRQYLNTECVKENKIEVETLIAALNRPRPANIAELQETFIRFTNDLDKSRGQSLQKANPRLYEKLAASGFDFAGKYQFA